MNMCMMSDGTRLSGSGVRRLRYNESVKFEITCSIAACTSRLLNEACDAVENQFGWSGITIIPPSEGSTEFELFASEDDVVVDLDQIKRALVEALEAEIWP
ncbi:MAG: hypothetical protein Q6370_012350 [Candidatus Sigynarchaeota archaeon]